MYKALPIVMIILLVLAVGATVIRKAMTPVPDSAGGFALPKGAPPPEVDGGGVSITAGQSENSLSEPSSSEAHHEPGAAAEVGTFTSLSEALKQPDKVEKLLLTELLGEMPRAISGFTRIRVLDLRIPIDQLPPEIAELKTLEELVLYCTGISDLPAWLATLPNLRALAFGGDLDCGHTVQLSRKTIEVLATMKQLKELDLNFLSDAMCPPELGALTGLELLNLEYNGLETLPPELGNMRGLRILRLSNNALQELPPTLSRLSNLEQLELGDNLFSRLPAVVEKLPKLKRLNLSSIQEGALRLTSDEKSRIQAALPHVEIVIQD